MSLPDTRPGIPGSLGESSLRPKNPAVQNAVDKISAALEKRGCSKTGISNLWLPESYSSLITNISMADYGIDPQNPLILIAPEAERNELEGVGISQHWSQEYGFYLDMQISRILGESFTIGIYHKKDDPNTLVAVTASTVRNPNCYLSKERAEGFSDVLIAVKKPERSIHGGWDFDLISATLSIDEVDALKAAVKKKSVDPQRYRTKDSKKSLTSLSKDSQDAAKEYANIMGIGDKKELQEQELLLQTIDSAQKAGVPSEEVKKTVTKCAGENSLVIAALKARIAEVGGKLETPTQEEFDEFLLEVEDGLKYVGVLSENQKLDPEKVLFPELYLVESAFSKVVFESAGIPITEKGKPPFDVIYYGNPESRNPNVGIPVTTEDGVELILPGFLTRFPHNVDLGFISPRIGSRAAWTDINASINRHVYPRNKDFLIGPENPILMSCFQPGNLAICSIYAENIKRFFQKDGSLIPRPQGEKPVFAGKKEETAGERGIRQIENTLKNNGLLKEGETLEGKKIVVPDVKGRGFYPGDLPFIFIGEDKEVKPGDVILPDLPNGQNNSEFYALRFDRIYPALKDMVGVRISKHDPDTNLRTLKGPGGKQELNQKLRISGGELCLGWTWTGEVKAAIGHLEDSPLGKRLVLTEVTIPSSDFAEFYKNATENNELNDVLGQINRNLERANGPQAESLKSIFPIKPGMVSMPDLQIERISTEALARMGINRESLQFILVSKEDAKHPKGEILAGYSEFVKEGKKYPQLKIELGRAVKILNSGGSMQTINIEKSDERTYIQSLPHNYRQVLRHFDGRIYLDGSVNPKNVIVLVLIKDQVKGDRIYLRSVKINNPKSHFDERGNLIVF